MQGQTILKILQLPVTSPVIGTNVTLSTSIRALQRQI